MSHIQSVHGLYSPVPRSTRDYLGSEHSLHQQLAATHHHLGSTTSTNFRSARNDKQSLSTCATSQVILTSSKSVTDRRRFTPHKPRILNAVGSEKYNQVNWTFLSEPKTNYKQAFQRTMKKFNNQNKGVNIQDYLNQNGSFRFLGTDHSEVQLHVPKKKGRSPSSHQKSEGTDDEETMKLQDEVLSKFTRHLEDEPRSASKQLDYFMSQTSKKKPTEKEKKNLDLQIQFNVDRQKIGVSSIPLEVIFNEKIDKIKTFERRTNRNPAPINLMHCSNFNSVQQLEKMTTLQNKDKLLNEMYLAQTMEKSSSISLVNIRCDEYGLSQNYLFAPQAKRDGPQLPKTLYLSDLQRDRLSNRLEKEFHKTPSHYFSSERNNEIIAIQKNINAFRKNLQRNHSLFDQLMGYYDSNQVPRRTRNMLRTNSITSNSFIGEEGLQNQEDIFDLLNGKENNEEIKRLLQKMKKQEIPSQYIEIMKTSNIFKSGDSLPESNVVLPLTETSPQPRPFSPRPSDEAIPRMSHVSNTSGGDLRQKILNRQNHLRKLSIFSQKLLGDQDQLKKLQKSFIHAQLHGTKMSKEEINTRLVSLTKDYMNKGQVIKNQSQNQQPTQENENKGFERFKNMTHHLYLKYPVEVLKPNIHFMINNAEAQNSQKIEEEAKLEEETTEEKIGIMRSTQISPGNLKNSCGLNLPRMPKERRNLGYASVQPNAKKAGMATHRRESSFNNFVIELKKEKEEEDTEESKSNAAGTPLNKALLRLPSPPKSPHARFQQQDEETQSTEEAILEKRPPAFKTHRLSPESSQFFSPRRSRMNNFISPQTSAKIVTNKTMQKTLLEKMLDQEEANPEHDFTQQENREAALIRLRDKSKDQQFLRNVQQYFQKAQVPKQIRAGSSFSKQDINALLSTKLETLFQSQKKVDQKRQILEDQIKEQQATTKKTHGRPSQRRSSANIVSMLNQMKLRNSERPKDQEPPIENISADKLKEQMFEAIKIKAKLQYEEALRQKTFDMLTPQEAKARLYLR